MPGRLIFLFLLVAAAVAVAADDAAARRRFGDVAAIRSAKAAR